MEFPIDQLLAQAVKSDSSDIHLKVGSAPLFRVHGNLRMIKMPPLTSELIAKWAFEMMNERHRALFQKSNQVDLSYAVSGVGRFRVNIFTQRGNIGLAIRTIPLACKSIDDLHLPAVLREIAMTSRGLVLVTGATGSGKSTTLAAMIDYINAQKAEHILTVEDPVEYEFFDKKSYINQREIGRDAVNFSDCLRAALREDPDVIFIGEMRDLETIDIALKAAETGHLVFSTLHTIDAVETANRIIAVFPSEQQRLVRHRLSQVLKAIISQRLVKTKDGRGRVAAVEVLKNTRRVTEILEEGTNLGELHDVIRNGFDSYRMQTFDQSLMQHLKDGFISVEEALYNATNAQDFQLRLQGIQGSGGATWDALGADRK